MPGEKKSSSGETPKWMATFADLSTLLMTFFVLLLSFASMDVQKFKDMLGSIQTAFGVQFEERGDYQPVKRPETETPGKARTDDPVISQKVVQQQEEVTKRESSAMANQIETMVRQSQLDKSVQVTKGPRGVRVRVKGGLFFDAGSASLKTQAGPFLRGVIKILHQSRFFLIVEGHTDNVPIKNAYFPSNWELSAARATAVVRFISEKGGVSAKRIAAIGFGPNYPIASNRSAEGRNRNRRVEFIFTKLSPRVAVR